MQHPWETGWERAESPAPQSNVVATKVVLDSTYRLWKSPQGDETIQKNGEYFRVSPGAFNTIPLMEGGSRGIAAAKEQT